MWLQVCISGEQLVLYALLVYSTTMALNGISICINGNIGNFVAMWPELIIS